MENVSQDTLLLDEADQKKLAHNLEQVPVNSSSNDNIQEKPLLCQHCSPPAPLNRVQTRIGRGYGYKYECSNKPPCRTSVYENTVKRYLNNEIFSLYSDLPTVQSIQPDSIYEIHPINLLHNHVLQPVFSPNTPLLHAIIYQPIQTTVEKSVICCLKIHSKNQIISTSAMVKYSRFVDILVLKRTLRTNTIEKLKSFFNGDKSIFNPIEYESDRFNLAIFNPVHADSCNEYTKFFSDIANEELPLQTILEKYTTIKDLPFFYTMEYIIQLHSGTGDDDVVQDYCTPNLTLLHGDSDYILFTVPMVPTIPQYGSYDDPNNNEIERKYSYIANLQEQMAADQHYWIWVSRPLLFQYIMSIHLNINSMDMKSLEKHPLVYDLKTNVSIAKHSFLKYTRVPLHKIYELSLFQPIPKEIYDQNFKNYSQFGMEYDDEDEIVDIIF